MDINVIVVYLIWFYEMVISLNLFEFHSAFKITVVCLLLHLQNVLSLKLVSGSTRRMAFALVVVYCWVVRALFILNIRPLSDMWFGNIFFHPVDSLFTVLLMSFDAYVFNFDEVYFVYIFIGCLCFCWHI